MPANESLGSLGYALTLDDTSFEKRLQEVEAKYRNTTNSLIQQTGQFDKAFGNAMKLGAAYLTLDGAKNVVNELISIRGEYQQLGNAMEVMLQSKEKGDKLMAEVTQLAATTPFTLSQVGQGAKQLLAYGSAAENITDELRMLGDISSGVGSEIQDLTYLYGTLRMQGRAMTIDIRQFASRGIPIYEELGKITGKTGVALQKMIEDGKIGFPQVEQAFKNLTKEGGQFGGLMAKNSQSLTGLMSNMKDAYAQMMNKIGASQQGVLSDGIKGITSLMNHYEPLLKIIEGVVIVYGSYRAALMLVTIGTNVYSAALARQTALYWAGMAATEGLTLKTLILNTTLKANPYVLIGTALIALIAAMYAYGDEVTDLEKQQRSYNDAINETKIKTDELKKKNNEVVESINDITKSEAERKRILDQLIATNPDVLKGLTLQNISTVESSKLLDQNSWELERNGKLRLAQANLDKTAEIYKDQGSMTHLGMGQYIDTRKSKAEKQKEGEALQKAQQEFNDILASRYKEKEPAKTNFNGGGDTDKERLAKLKAFQKEQARLWEEQSKEFDRIQKEITDKEDQENKKRQDSWKNLGTEKVRFIEQNNELSQRMAEREAVRLEAAGLYMLDWQEKTYNDYMEKARLKAERDEEDFNKKLDLANQLASILSPNGVLGKLTGIGTQLTSIFNDKDNQKKGKFDFGLGALDLASVGLSGINMIIGGIQKHKAEKKAYYELVLKMQREYNLAINEQLLIENKSSLIGNIVGQYKGNFDLILEAQKDYNQIYDKIAKLTLPGNGGNFLDSLKSKFPELFNNKGEINVPLGNIILQDAGTIVKEDLQSLIALQEQINSAKEAIDQLTTSIGGSLENSLRNVIVKAFEDGKDSAIDFGNEVGNVLENISSQILFQAVFAKAFEQLKKDLDTAFESGDTDLSQEFGALMAGNDERLKQFNDGLKQIQEQGKAFGFDLFKGGETGSKDQLSGSIKGITEDTASVLAGNMNMIRIMQAKQYEAVLMGVEYQKQTAENTLHLVAIKNSLAGNSFRANGL